MTEFNTTTVSNDDNNTISPSYAYPQLLTWVVTFTSIAQKFVSPCILSLGLVGNSLMFMLMNQAEFRHTSTSIYMSWLSVSDTIYLLGRGFQRFLFLVLPKMTNFELFRVTCLEFIIIGMFAQQLSFYLLVAMTYDRVFAIMFPLKSLTSSSFKRAKIVSFSLFLLALATAFGVNVFRSYIPALVHKWTCPFYFPEPYATYITLVDSSLGCLVCLLLIGSNVILVRIILKSRKKRHRMKGGVVEKTENSVSVIKTSVTNMDSTVTATEACKDNTNRSVKEMKIPKKSSGNENHILIMLLTVSVTFLIGYATMRIQFFYWWIFEPKNLYELQMSGVTFEVAMILENCNASLNFYLYALPSLKFRTALLRMLRMNRK